MKIRIACAALAVAGLLLPGLSQAELVQCRPAKNCAAAGKPCYKGIQRGQTETLKAGPGAGTPVIRVRVCGGSVTDVCKGGAAGAQEVRVWGKGLDADGDGEADELYAKSLDLSGGNNDTGNYTEVPKLTHLSVRCGNTQGWCNVAWQICRKALPVAQN